MLDDQRDHGGKQRVEPIAQRAKHNGEIVYPALSSSEAEALRVLLYFATEPPARVVVDSSDKA